MLRNFHKNRKGQHTAEYALLIALVVAAVIAMQTYAQRAVQARIHDASQYMENQTSSIGTSTQYEPYYMNSSYTVATNSEDQKILAAGQGAQTYSTSNRETSGSQTTQYNGIMTGNQ